MIRTRIGSADTKDTGAPAHHRLRPLLGPAAVIEVPDNHPAIQARLSAARCKQRLMKTKIFLAAILDRTSHEDDIEFHVSTASKRA